MKNRLDTIYIQPNAHDRWFEGNKPNNNFVEYIRKDAFIEKVCNAYCKVCGHYPHTVPTHICRNDCDYFSDFKKYMKE